jgi:hypothetical protein
MKSLHINGLLLILAVPGTVGSLLLSNSTAAQMTPYAAKELPPANNAARVQITEGPKGRDLSTVERTEFRQFGDQGPGQKSTLVSA